ncbi:hypothetical protein Adt_36626 [Abeliophyllum distichum]|uniref:Uncharacterized protein n=1 Tax=Abeliophyllum distichum TaxID=126358 RepID=A0ABD1QI53_9LAMI
MSIDCERLKVAATMVVEVGNVVQEFEFDEQENPDYLHSFAFAFSPSYDKENSRTPWLHLLFSCRFCHSLAAILAVAGVDEVYSVAQWVSRDPSFSHFHIRFDENSHISG